jgi:hypothetical protein
LGRKVVSLGKSKLDDHKKEILEFVVKKVSVTSIAKIYGVNPLSNRKVGDGNTPNEAVRTAFLSRQLHVWF